MKSVLISIQPKWCELIASGKKTVEVRKTKPKLETPFKVYIYQTRRTWTYDIYSRIADWQGKVIGEFVCNCIGTVGWTSNPSKLDWKKGVYNEETCLTNEETYEYTKGDKFYEWHISDLVIYDKPKDLDYFRKPLLCHRGIQKDACIGCWDCEITRPPQSWCYVEEVG